MQLIREQYKWSENSGLVPGCIKESRNPCVQSRLRHRGRSGVRRGIRLGFLLKVSLSEATDRTLIAGDFNNRSKEWGDRIGEESCLQRWSPETT